MSTNLLFDRCSKIGFNLVPGPHLGSIFPLVWCVCWFRTNKESFALPSSLGERWDDSSIRFLTRLLLTQLSFLTCQRSQELLFRGLLQFFCNSVECRWKKGSRVHVWQIFPRLSLLVNILSVMLVGVVVCVHAANSYLQLKPLMAFIGLNSPDTTFNLSAVSRWLQGLSGLHSKTITACLHSTQKRARVQTWCLSLEH